MLLLEGDNKIRSEIVICKAERFIGVVWRAEKCISYAVSSIVIVFMFYRPHDNTASAILRYTSIPYDLCTSMLMGPNREIYM